MDGGTFSVYAGLPPGQGPQVSDDGAMGSLLSDILLYSYYAQVNAEVRNRILCDTPSLSTNEDIQAYTTGLFSSLQSGPIQRMGEAWMPYYEPPLLPVRELSQSARTPLSDIMIVKSTLPGHEDVPHAWIGDSAYAKVAEVDAIHSSGQHSVPTSASSDQSHLYTYAEEGTSRNQTI